MIKYSEDGKEFQEITFTPISIGLMGFTDEYCEEAAKKMLGDYIELPTIIGKQYKRK